MGVAELVPKDTPEYMWPAWAACMSWAIGKPEIVAAFREDTGQRWEPGRTPFERMIDEATGADGHFIVAFIRWANVNVWGPLKTEDDSASPSGGQPEKD